MTNKCILIIFILSGVLVLAGCSFTSVSKEKNPNNNVAYAVPDRIANEGVDTRRKPTRPLWTEEFVDEVPVARPEQIQTDVYIVKKGDTLYGISRNFGISARELMDLNNMDNNTKLSVGQKIQLPSCELAVENKLISNVSKVDNNKVSIYKVQSGDSLFKIAKSYSMNLKEIKALNNLTSDKIYPGQSLKVYGTNPNNEKKGSDVVSSVKHSFKLDSDGYYSIQPGDTLGGIAKGFRVKVEQLKEANGITDPMKLQIGRKLIIPSDDMYASTTRSHYNDFSANKKPEVVSSPKQDAVEQPVPEQIKSTSDDFFENFEEIPVIEINN